MFISHKTEEGHQELVVDHLREVAEMAAEFARPFGAQDWAYAAGMAHDIGKFSTEFQNRILRDGHRVDHSTAGAFELTERNYSRILAYCVAGHHGGLPNGGSLADVDEGVTLQNRLKKARDGRLPDYHAFEQEISLPERGYFRFDNVVAQDGFSVPFLTRMLFSCLVDADYLCTERFMRGEAREQLSEENLEALYSRIEEKVRSFYPPQTALNEIRCGLLDACSESAQGKPGVYSLTVPTGGGKTIESLYFALKHAHVHGMRRVVYGVPYTSIIEQNAQVFRELLGERAVLEHHANFDFDDRGEEGEVLRLATENWDAPVVVTTNVQLFESLFANKTSRCRKLHNLANSVIVLDEAQMIPTKQLLPCVRALAELVHRYGCTVVLCTATQPSLDGFFEKFGCSVREIAPDPQEIYERLRRVEYCFAGPLEDPALAERLASHDQVLCIVNNRRQARRLYELIADRGVYGEGGVFHLSTLMHAVHRECVLKEVRRRLKAGEPCCVVSTSLIEAGVDVDFPVAYRALAGIDSMVQCAGRCNREAKRSKSESVVYLFEAATSYGLPADIRQKAAVSHSVLQRRGIGDARKAGDARGAEEGCRCDIGSLEVIHAYFDQLHELRAERLDATHALSDMTNFSTIDSMPFIPFERVAKEFRMIEEGSRTVLVPDESVAYEVRALRTGFATRSDMRRLSRFSVGLYDVDVKTLLSAGALMSIEEGTYLLIDSDLYRKETGLDVEEAGGKGIVI
ncbi:MAG: CRISPR-associated helicase Cas3' [Gordonibacter sp.]|nr:CRISPR-associated helicase Cas3' [Gordonibacter sp.]